MAAFSWDCAVFAQNRPLTPTWIALGADQIPMGLRVGMGWPDTGVFAQHRNILWRAVKGQIPLAGGKNAATGTDFSRNET